MGRDVISGAMSVGELTAFVAYAVLVAATVGAISQVVSELQRAAGAMESLMELLEAKNEITAPENPRQLNSEFKGLLELSDVRFAYSSRPETPALDGVSLVIQPGENVALVVSSGAGKSTLFDLVLRFYDPQSGSVLLDGIDIRELNPQVLRSHIAIVSQQPAMFTGNVWDNIRYGRPDASDDEVRAAAESAFAHEFIERLPESYDSYLGESGIRLSGGQRQRIAIVMEIQRFCCWMRLLVP